MSTVSGLVVRDAASIATRPASSPSPPHSASRSAYMVIRGIVLAGEVLSLIAVALVVGIGLDPAVRFLTKRGFSRPWAVVVITAVFLSVVGGFVAMAVPPISHEITALTNAVPSSGPTWWRAVAHSATWSPGSI